MRWANGPECPHCGEVGRAYFLKARSGHRTTSAGNPSYRRLWKCASCRKQFSVLIGTVFESSHVPLSKWLFAVYMMVSNKNGVASFEIHRTLKVTPKTAWFMMHRIREAVKCGPLADMLRGTIVSDETWIGGEPKNRHASKRDNRPVPVIPGEQVTMHTDKTPVLTLIDAETGESRSQVITRADGPTIHKAMSEHVDMAASVLWTDSASFYGPIGRQFVRHETVNHHKGEYVSRKTGASTNKAENYFAQLKTSIAGTHHGVSPGHLNRYLGEFDYRYSTRKVTDSERMRLLMDRADGRLTWKLLVGQ